MKIDYKTALISFFFTLFLISVIFNAIEYDKKHKPDEIVVKICTEYAKEDHTYDMSAERYQKLSHWWSDFDYYTSCLINSGFKGE